MHSGGIVLPFKIHLGGTVPPFKMHPEGTLDFVLNFFELEFGLNSKNRLPLKVLILVQIMKVKIQVKKVKNVGVRN